MLTETLGILIGFVTVILLFSMIVTSLSQAIQSVLSLRSHFLRTGIESFLTATRVKLAQNQRVSDLAKALVPREATWIEKDELLSDLKDRGVELTQEFLDRFDLQFRVMSRYMTKEFTRTMNYVSLGFGFALAIIFQVSTFELLKRLSTEPELRASLDALAVTLASGKNTPSGGAEPYGAVAERALERFTAQHLDLAATLEEVSTRGQSRAELVGELKMILEARSNPKAAELSEDYAAMLDTLHAESVKANLGAAKSTANQLALYDIRIWPHGWRFYLNLNNAIGVLLSGILISLGAPFWFNTLKNLMNLRDMLKPKEAKIDDTVIVKPTVVNAVPPPPANVQKSDTTQA